MTEQERLLTSSELARRLNLSVRTIQHYRQKGVLVPDMETPGGQARWLESSVRDQLKKYAEERRRTEERRQAPE